MARFNVHIGAKLGLTVAIGVVLIGGMPANQLLGNQSIAILSRWVVTSNKANAQSVDSTILQAATRDSVVTIKKTGATITRIADIASTIAATVEEQGAAIAEIARNVGEAAKSTAEVAWCSR
jgi:methyl-accepting chemotaxis protein